MTKVLSIIACCLLLCACTKDRSFISDSSNPNGEDTTNEVAHLKINEVLAKGSLLSSELGNTCDWLEIYNQSSSEFHLKAGEWFISDNPLDLEKFQLPDFTMAPGEFVVLFCDDSNRVQSQIHTNFGLSSGGETVLLSRKTNGNTNVQDSMSFGVQAFDNMSIARTPDGSNNWSYPSNPTPGSSNQ